MFPLNQDRQFDDTSGMMTLAEAFEDARLTMIANDRRPMTLEVLADTARHFIRIYGADVPLDAPLKDKLRKFKSDFLARGKAPNTTNRALRSYKRVCRLAGLSPKIDMMKVPRKKVDALTVEEINSMLDSFQAVAHRLYPMALFAVDTGARRAEIALLEWDYVNLETRRVIIHDAKSGDQRVVPLSPRLVEVLSKLPRGKFVFRALPTADRPYQLDALSRAFRRAFQRIGLREKDGKGGARRAMHVLRKSFATRASANGVPIKVAMAIGGWKQVSTMLNYYVEVSEESMEDAIDKLADPARKPV